MQSSNPPPRQLLETLQQPSPDTCRAEAVDFASVGFSEHKDAFALLIHDLLTPAECDALLAAAEGTTSGQWNPALINGGYGDVLNTDVRLCDRILWDDQVVADALLARILPHLPGDIKTLGSKSGVTNAYPEWSRTRWRATRLNERLRFLRYTPGMYFRSHYDGHYVTPDETEVSFLTIHVYLRGSSDLDGGATRFFGMDDHYKVNHYDVDPAPGACLVFQHHDLEHSGEDVRKGTKYTVRTDLMYEEVPDENSGDDPDWNGD